MTANQLTPLTSPTTPMVVGQAAAPAALPRFSPIDPIRLLRQYAKWVILAAAIGFLIGRGGLRLPTQVFAGILQHRTAVGYRRRHKLERARPPRRPPQARRRIALDILINNQIVLLHSDDLLNEALLQPRIRETIWFKSLSTPDQQLRALREELSAGNTRGTNIVSLTLTGRYWGDLKVILGEIINVYLRRYQRGVDDQQLTLRKVYFTERDRADKDATNLFDELKRYKTEHQLPDIEVGRTDVGIAYEQLATQRVSLQQSLEQANDAYRSMAEAQRRGDSLVPTPDDMAMVDRDPSVTVYIEQLRALREERKVERSHGFAENHPNIRNIDDRIQAAEMAKKKEEDRLLHERQALQIEAASKNLLSIKAEVESIDKRLDATRTAVRDMNEQIAKYKEMEQLANAAAPAAASSSTGCSTRCASWNHGPTPSPSRPCWAPPTRNARRPSSPPTPWAARSSSAAWSWRLPSSRSCSTSRVKSPADIKLFPNAKLIGVIPDANEDPHGPAQVESRRPERSQRPHRRVVPAGPHGALVAHRPPRVQDAHDRLRPGRLRHIHRRQQSGAEPRLQRPPRAGARRQSPPPDATRVLRHAREARADRGAPRHGHPRPGDRAQG